MDLSLSAKKKRTYDRSNPAYKWVALAVVILGIGAFLYGIYSLLTHAGFGMYFLLFGLGSNFFCSPERMYCQPPKTIKNISKISWNDPFSKWKHTSKNIRTFPVRILCTSDRVKKNAGYYERRSCRDNS